MLLSLFIFPPPPSPSTLPPASSNAVRHHLTQIHVLGANGNLETGGKERKERKGKERKGKESRDGKRKKREEESRVRDQVGRGIGDGWKGREGREGREGKEGKEGGREGGRERTFNTIPAAWPACSCARTSTCWLPTKTPDLKLH